MKASKIAVVSIMVILLFGCEADISIVGYWVMPDGSNTRTLDFKDYGEVKATALNGRQWGYYDYDYSDGVLTIFNDSPPSTTVGTAIVTEGTLTLSGFGSHFIADGIYYRD